MPVEAPVQRQSDQPVVRAAAGAAWAWGATGLPLLASVLVSAIFIARSAFTIGGEVYFSLFDDAMISMRFARNLAAGDGLVWNPGQAPIEGYTNLLWTLWMAGLHLVGAPEAKASLLVMVSGAGLLLANVWLVGRIARRLLPGSGLVVALSMWLTGLYYPLIFWTLRGMEVGLVTLMLTAMQLLALRLTEADRRLDRGLMMATMAAGLLTRTDMLVPCLVVLGFLLRHGRRPRPLGALLGATIAATLLLHTGFRLLYYGDPLPNTYYLKVEGFSLPVRLHAGLVTFLDTSILHLGPALAVVGGGLLLGRRLRHPAALLLSLVFLGQSAYSIYVGDAWEVELGFASRYLTPAVPALLILVAWTLGGLGRPEAVSGRRARWLGPGLGAAVLLLVPAWLLLRDQPPRSVDLIWTPAMIGLLAALLWLFRRRKAAGPAATAGRDGGQARRLALLYLTLLLLVALHGPAVSSWLAHNAPGVAEDALMTEFGLALRESTAPEATIAAVWSGAIPYFARRTAVDLLGKTDRVVARSVPQPGRFRPGHNKWQYAHSIGQLRPDVVAQLWKPTEVDWRQLEAWGYRRYSPTLYVRADSPAVDWARLANGRLTPYQCCLTAR